MTAARTRKRSFVGAAAKSMHFAGRQFVRVAASLQIRVRMFACMSACLCDTVTVPRLLWDVVERLPRIATVSASNLATFSDLRLHPVASISTDLPTSRYVVEFY